MCGPAQHDNEMIEHIVALMRSNVHVAIVTAAGYPGQAERFEQRVEGLLAAFRHLRLSAEVTDRFERLSRSGLLSWLCICSNVNCWFSQGAQLVINWFDSSSNAAAASLLLCSRAHRAAAFELAGPDMGSLPKRQPRPGRCSSSLSAAEEPSRGGRGGMC